MASTWGTSWGTSWATSWDRTVVTPPPGGGGLAGGRPLRRRQWREIKAAWLAQKAAKRAAEREQLRLERERQRLLKKKRKTEQREEQASVVLLTMATATAAEALNMLDASPYGEVLGKLNELKSALQAMAKSVSVDTAKAVVTAAQELKQAIFDQDEEEVSIIVLAL